MTGFEAFPGQSRGAPTARVTAFGTLTLSAAAMALLEGRRDVILSADRDNGQIRLEPCAAPTADTYRVDESGQISARRFVQYFGLGVDDAWVLHGDGEAIIGEPDNRP